MKIKKSRDLIRRIIGDDRFFRFGYLFLRLTQDNFRQSIKKMKELKDIHSGERCFIIGNGPSLKTTDLSLLKNEFTFGLNRLYLLFPDMGFYTTYHVAVNKLVVEQFGKEIQQETDCPLFFSYDARHWVNFTPQTMFIYSRNGPHFYTDITKGIWQGATVTYTAMQIAYYMGFNKVILIGVDHSFSTEGTPHDTVTSQDGDMNHFDPNYFGPGVRWQLPDLETSEIAYRLAREKFKHDNREIVDATIGGALTVFPKVDYLSLFE